jgi:hypothetical protein
MILDKYLANHSPNRHLDKVIIKWFLTRNGNAYFDKSKEDWDSIISDFFGETEKKIEDPVALVAEPKEDIIITKINSKKGDVK